MLVKQQEYFRIDERYDLRPGSIIPFYFPVHLFHLQIQFFQYPHRSRRPALHHLCEKKLIADKGVRLFALKKESLWFQIYDE